MNQFQIQMMKHFRSSSKKLQSNSFYDTNHSSSQERKRSNTQTSCNSSSTNPFTQLESSTHYDNKTLGLNEVDYIPEVSRESSVMKKRRTVELDAQNMNDLITPSRVNVLRVENDTSNQRSLSTDFSSIKKNNFSEEKKLKESISSLKNKLLQNQLYQEQKSVNENTNEQIINRIVHLDSFYNFPCLYDKEEKDSRRRSREYSQTVQERNEIRRNRSLSANQQKYIHSIIENGKTQYKKVKRVYSSSQSRLRFISDKEQFSKDVFTKVYDDCKRSSKQFDSIIKSSNSLSRSSLHQPSINHPIFPSHVKQTDVQLKRQSMQRVGINQKFYELEESMRFCNSEKIDFTHLMNSVNSKNLLESNTKQENLILSHQLNENVNVSQFQGQNINQIDQSQNLNGNQKLIQSTKFQNTLNLQLNSPNLLNSDNFEILNSLSVKSQKPSQGQQGCKPLVYSAQKYMNQCSSLQQLEKDLQRYREVQQLQQFKPDIYQQKQQPQQQIQQQQQSQTNFNSAQKVTQNKKLSRKEYLQGKCRHNITTMYCSICNRQVKSKI